MIKHILKKNEKNIYNHIQPNKHTLHKSVVEIFKIYPLLKTV